MHDYLVVGAGIFGAVCARELTDAGKSCLVIDRRPHIAGNIYSELKEGIQVHMYGAHIFHTSDKVVWNYMTRFGEFNHYVNAPVAKYKGKIYNLPFNMNTFYQLWGVTTPEEAEAKLESQRVKTDTPNNLEEQALSLAGRDIYETLIKEYTEKQWGRPCCELPAEIIRRLPFRFRYDNNYFNDRYQGIPVEGYTVLIGRMLEGIEVRTSTPYVPGDIQAKHIIYTGAIDEYFGYALGTLEYRSLRFETQLLERENFQGNAVVNYTSHEVPYTRIIEHKHFTFGAQPKTVVTWEYPVAWQRDDDPYYPVNDDKNNALYDSYKEIANREPCVTFGGRLGLYRYFDMDKTVVAALDCVRGLLS